MVRIAKHRLSGLLVVLVVAVSLHGAHGGSLPLIKAASIKGDSEAMASALKAAKNVKTGVSFVKGLVNFYLKNNQTEERSSSVPPGRSSTQLISNSDFPSLAYVGVSAIDVGSVPLPMGSMLDFDPANGGHGGVLMSTEYRLTFLNGKAYRQLKREINRGLLGAKLATSELGADVNQLCNAGVKEDQLLPITLLFAGGAEMKVGVDQCWYKQSDGSVCLAVLPSPWTTGETIVGTMLQTSGIEVVGDMLTF